MGSFEVIIIGAGPAGLALGAHLRKFGVNTLILERDQIASTWCRVPEGLRVLSPWWTNSLDMRSATRHFPLALVSAREYKNHLLDFAKRAQLPIVTGVNVSSVAEGAAGWEIIGDDGRWWSATFVVCATGYFGAPNRDVIGTDGSVPVLHSSDISNFEEFVESARGRRIAVIGKRVTAGQLAIELNARGCKVTICSNSPLLFRRVDLYGKIRENLYFVIEMLRILIQPTKKANSFPDMDGGLIELLLKSGLVRAAARPNEISKGALHLMDGSRIPVDAVVLATGFRPALSFLNTVCALDPRTGIPALEGFEITQSRGIFLLGFDNIRNFRSRALRGIRADSRVLAKLLLAQLVKRRELKASND